MTRRVVYSGESPEVELSLVFSGERLEISRLLATSGDTFITTQFLTQLALPKVIRSIGAEAVPHRENWMPKDGHSGLGLDSYDYLAQLYWFEHLTWGSPRLALMNYMGWSRANTNWHIRKIRKNFPLPMREARAASTKAAQGEG